MLALDTDVSFSCLDREYQRSVNLQEEGWRTGESCGWGRQGDDVYQCRESLLQGKRQYQQVSEITLSNDCGGSPSTRI